MNLFVYFFKDVVGESTYEFVMRQRSLMKKTSTGKESSKRKDKKSINKNENKSGLFTNLKKQIMSSSYICFKNKRRTNKINDSMNKNNQNNNNDDNKNVPETKINMNENSQQTEREDKPIQMNGYYPNQLKV